MIATPDPFDIATLNGRPLIDNLPAAPPAVATGAAARDADDAVSGRPPLERWTLTQAARDPQLTAPPLPIVPPFAYAGRVTLLSAREKMGKSTLVGQVVASLVTGAPCFDTEVAPPEPVPVLWFALDEDLSDAVRRLERFGALKAGDQGSDRVILYREQPTAAQLADAVKKERARLIVVDTLSELWRGSVTKENDTSQVTAFLRPYIHVVRDAGAALLLIHHATKGTGEYRGTTGLGAMVDAVLTFEAVGSRAASNAEDAADADAADQPAGDDGHRRLSGRTRWEPGKVDMRLSFESGRYTSGDASVSLSVRVLRAVQAHPGASGKKLATVLHTRTQSVLDTIRALVDMGCLTKTTQGFELTDHGASVKSGAPLSP